MNSALQRINWAQKLLHLTYIFLPIIAGIDKFFHCLVDWNIYVNEELFHVLPISQQNFMYGVGIIEICAGLLVFLYPRIGGLIIAIWLVLISINLITMGSHTHHGYRHNMTHYDVAIRDLALAIGAYVLFLLS